MERQRRRVDSVSFKKPTSIKKKKEEIERETAIFSYRIYLFGGIFMNSKNKNCALRYKKDRYMRNNVPSFSFTALSAFQYFCSFLIYFVFFLNFPVYNISIFSFCTARIYRFKLIFFK